MITNAAFSRLLFALGIGVCLPLQAMDRWEALSLVESADNDRATGPGGEVSRYQIKQEVWQRYAPTNADSGNPQDALAVAKIIMQKRCAAFERTHHRPPSDFEFYVLWNAPAQADAPAPSKTVANRAERFCNLVKTQLPPPVEKHAETNQAR